jgi:hypothetical protein
MKTATNIDWVKISCYGIILVLTIILATGGCSHPKPKPQIITVKVPEVRGYFKPQKPRVINTHDTLYLKNPIDNRLVVENEKLKTDFAAANDSIKKLLFAKAVKLNAFSSKFEDENIKINVNGIVQGEVKEITPNYTIKEKKVEVQIQPKETVFRLLAGAEIGDKITLNAFMAKANLHFQNRKGNLLSLGYDTDQRIWIGYTISILNIKK